MDERADHSAEDRGDEMDIEELKVGDIALDRTGNKRSNVPSA